MASQIEYHNCPLCGVQPYNVPAVNHVLHFLITVLSCGVWIFVWLFLGSIKGAATCASCGLTLGQARRSAGKQDKQFDKEERRALIEEAKEHYNTYGPEVGSRVKVTQGDYKGRFGTVVANDGAMVTIADKKGRQKTLPMTDFRR